MTNQEWQKESRYLGEVATGIIGRRFYVKNCQDGLGCTCKGVEIQIAKEYPLYEKMKTNEAKVFRLGVLVHEVLHQLFTNFDYTNKILTKLRKDMIAKGISPDRESYFLMTICNLVEDPAIENFAPTVVGGYVLDALYFTIKKSYYLAKEIAVNATTPAQEFINALIDFGDGGFVTRKFVFPEARDKYYEIVPDFYKAINEPDNKKRIDMSVDIYEKSKSLWASNSDEQMQQLEQAIAELLKQFAKSNEQSGKGSGGTPEQSDKETEKQKRQKTFIKKCESKKNEKDSEKDATNGKNSKDDKTSKNGNGNGEKGSDEQNAETDANQSSGDGNDADQNSNQSQSSGAPGEGNDANESSNQSESGETSGTQDGNGKNESTSDAAETSPADNGDDSSDSQSDNSRSNSQPPSFSDGDQNSDSGSDEIGKDFDIEPPTVDESVIESIINATEESWSESQEAQDDKSNYYEQPENLNAEVAKELDCSRITSAEHLASRGNMDLSPYYDKYLESLSDGIYFSELRLKKIFRNDREEKIKTKSGKINLDVYASGKVTARVFERKKAPADKLDMCVMMLTDNSGSMYGDKIGNAIASNIAICEIMNYFKIPTYCIGFTTTTCDSDQTHYVKWSNTRYERENLCLMAANGGNFDSFAITYAYKLLEKRKEKHKILIVLSDGLPSDVFSGETGIQKNQEAILKASKKADVIGIGLGNIKVESFVRMYGEDKFIHVKKPSDLFDNLADKLTNIVKRWQ